MQSTEPTAPPNTKSPGTALTDGFVKVEGGATEQVSEVTSLMLAYSAIWLILVMFTLVTWRALRSLRAHAERVDRALSDLPRTPH